MAPPPTSPPSSPSSASSPSSPSSPFFLAPLALALVAAAPACTAAAPDGPPEGYVRLEATPVAVPAGGGGQWVQYVAAPMAEDMDIVDIIGEQGPAGHHAILYATPDVQPIGTTREWHSIDQVVDRFLGGIGGEGAEAIRLPDGAVFRIPAGNALYLNTHYLNASDQDVVGTSRVDVKLAPASPERAAVGMFANVDLGLTLPPQQVTERTTTCVVEQDLDLVMFTNHMHDYGTRARTTITAPGGEPVVLKDDPAWVAEWQANPNFERETLAAPRRLVRGTTITTECAWNNTSGRELAFPDEMCLFLGFHLASGHDLACVDGRWMD
jgi:hypothetical protein